MRALARAIGFKELVTGVVLVLDTRVVLALLSVKVVKATNERTEVEELEDTFEELLGIDEGLYSENDVVDETLLAGKGPIGSGCIYGGGCTCGSGCLIGAIVDAFVGALEGATVKAVPLPSKVGRTWRGRAKLGQELAVR